MIQAARDAGLGVYMDHGWGLYKVPQDKCSPLDPSTQSAGDEFLAYGAN